MTFLCKLVHDKVGVTKGAFYYYFSSKEDVLEALTMQLAKKTVAITKEIANHPDLDALEKINQIILKTYEHRLKNIQTYSRLVQITEGESNILFKHRLLDKVMLMVKEPYTGIIEQGISDGKYIGNRGE